MKIKATLCALAVVMAVGTPLAMAQATTYNFGDHRSSTLTTKAWQSLEEGNLEGVLAYTNKCVEMYAENARQMQEKLENYPAGDNQEIFSYWALNDIATSLYIQGEAYRKAGRTEEAKAAFGAVVNHYSFGQAYDPASKSFWKPAEAAKEKIAMMVSGLDLDFGDMSSAFLVTKAWAALGKKDLASVKAYVEKNLSVHGQRAREMQTSLKEFAWESPEKIHEYWALNDIGTALFVLGQAYHEAGQTANAIKTFQTLIDDYGYSQCWDPQGWFWKPAEASQQRIIEIEAVQ